MRPHRPWQRYLGSVLLIATITLLAQPLAPILSPTNLVMLYLAAEVMAAVYLGRGPSMLAALLGVLAFDFFLVPPQLTFAVADSQYILTFIGLFLVGIVITTLVDRVQNQAEVAKRGEMQATQLAGLSRDLAAAAGVEAVVSALLSHVAETFGREAAVLLPAPSALPAAGGLQIHSLSPSLTLDENELAVADWVFKHGKPAGRGTDTLPAAANRYLPIKTAQGVLGVLSVCPADPAVTMAPEQRQLLDAFASQAGVAIERAQLAEHARELQVLQATEKLQSALLNSISHELRTPLVSITGALSSLKEENGHLSDAERRDLAADGYEEAERLNRLVGNLLGMTRIEAGALRVHSELSDVEEIIGIALERVDAGIAGRDVQVTAAHDLPPAKMDPGLIVQVLVNLLDNSVKYSPDGAPIRIDVSETPTEQLQIGVMDRGSGIPPGDLDRVFDKFYRVHRPDNVTGTGLGLSICKGIVEAHGGRIWAENRPGGGLKIAFTLPLRPSFSLVSASAGGLLVSPEKPGAESSASGEAPIAAQGKDGGSRNYD